MASSEPALGAPALLGVALLGETGAALGALLGVEPALGVALLGVALPC